MSFDLNEMHLTGEIADVSTAGQIYIPVPDAGYVKGIAATLNTAITVADAVLTVKVGGASVGTLTITQSGSAAGSTFSTSFNRSATNTIAAGGAVEVETDGGSTTASVTGVTVTIGR